jgi:uncharacterized protein with HEPN domain
MQPYNRDIALLLDAARDILQFTENSSYEEFASSKLLRFAVERQILVIGEAASRISNLCKDSHPEIPWKSIVGQRHVLAHEYGEILIERVWRVAKERIPVLIEHLEPLIPPPPDSDQ